MCLRGRVTIRNQQLKSGQVAMQTLGAWWYCSPLLPSASHLSKLVNADEVDHSEETTSLTELTELFTQIPAI